MGETLYVVRTFLNGREGCRPTEFESKENAISFINALLDMNNGILDYKIHLYEVKEIEY